MTDQSWKLKDGRIIDLIPSDDFDSLPNGTVLFSINGEQVVKGTDYIDKDTRFGYLAYGRLVDDNG